MYELFFYNYICKHKIRRRFKNVHAQVAQLVERQPSKLNVASSTLVFRSWKINRRFKNRKCGSSSVGRASAFQAECREFDPRLPLLEKSNEDSKIVNAEVAQLVERQPSKLNVASSTLVFRSWKQKTSSNDEVFLFYKL